MDHQERPVQQVVVAEETRPFGPKKSLNALHLWIAFRIDKVRQYTQAGQQTQEPFGALKRVEDAR